MVRTSKDETRDAGLSAEKHRRIMNLVLQSGEHMTVIDNGADTILLGQGWRRKSVHPTRTVSVSGADPNKMLLRGLPVGTGITTITVCGKVHLLQANEAIFNEGSPFSLLSDCQVSECVDKLDAKARKHGGEQAMWVNKEVKIPLTVKECLMTMTNQEPTEEELRDITPLIISLDTP